MFNGLTNIGKEYFAKCLAENKPITFSKVKIGDGLLGLEENAGLLTDIKSIKKEVEILDKTQDGEMTTLTILLDNSDVEVGYYPREIGIYVTDDGVEKLYWYINDGVESQWLCPATKYPIKFRQIINLMTTNLESVIVNWTGKDLYVDKEFVETKFNEAKDRVRAMQFSTIAELQTRKNLKVGDIVEVLGYYKAGDGAGHKRIIANEDDGSGVQLNNGLWANIVHNGEVNVSWFGCKYNSLENARTNYINLLKAINYNQTVTINGDLYIEQNGDNVVTSENLILKGKDKAKLILCTNFEKTDWFLINKNLKNLFFTDLEVKYNGTADGISVLFAIDGMIKVNNCDIENCVFNINSNGRLMSWTNANTNIKPDLSLHGFDVFNLKNNTFNNILNSFIMLGDVIYRELNIINNRINNFYYLFFSCGTNNDSIFENEITNNKLVTNIYNNIVINDDSFILNEGKAQSYYCFVLFEANIINYKNNYIEGIKSQDIAPLYDSYFGGNYLYYENNTWKNNLCFNIAKDNYQMMKSKAVVNKYYRNNTYIIEEEWLNKFNVDEKARIVNLEQQTSFSDNIVVDNNYIDVYYLIFHSSHPNITNYLFTNNKIKCKKSSNNIFMLGHSNEKISSSNYIVRNNFFDIGEKDKNTAIFQTYNDNPLNSIYKNIIFENNTFNLFIKTYDEVGKCYLFSSGLFGDNIVIRNNTINLEKDSNTEICLFNYTKMNYSNKFVFDNTFYSTNKVKNEYNWLAPDIIPRKKTNSNIKLETTTNGNVGFFLKGTFKERVDLVNIPKIDYKVKFILKKDSDFDIVRYLFFSLEKQNNEEKLTFYNSLGNQETVTVDPSSTSGIWNNFYFLDEDKKITTDYVSSTISNLDITIIVRTQLLYDTLDSEISIIGG